jgi:2-polyprenyl-3-methyl-5-hydroxy-6-metoxy-1,4-benzoquinol methylase
MDVVERLTLEAAQQDTMLASEHRHRYEFAARLCAGRRILDLCCGSGYGTALMAPTALAVTGIDNDAATVETARATVGREQANVDFELQDANAMLEQELKDRFDAVVCFEGLEHLPRLDEALTSLRRHAREGLRIIASVPNGKLFEEDNPFHHTTFGYDEAISAFADFPSTVMVPQFLAEGSLIGPDGATETDVRVSFADAYEPEYANHFIFCVNVTPEEGLRAVDGRMQLSASPVFNRWAEDLKRGAWELRRENARLGRARLGKSGSAAAAALLRVAESEGRVEALRERAELAEARVRELELGEAGPAPEAAEPEVAGSPAGKVEIFNGEPAPLPPGEDPNSWEQRRRRAGRYLIPWIEQTVPLRGRTVLEYGCGNAAVSCAFAQRAEQVLGLDIDGDAIELGRARARELGLKNVRLELHSLEAIAAAASAHQGQVDVFLLYAVLEHMTVAERLAVLRLAREVVKPDGAIVVCETPNRLIYFDHHTAQMPFFHLLPDELALEYFARSGRDQFTSAIRSAAQAGSGGALDAIVRWGRGVSFHEFEVAFGDLARHVIASSYDPILFPERPIQPDEVVLSRYLARLRPDLAPAWSRYWLDVILSPTEITRRDPFLTPWLADTTLSRGVGWTSWENLELAGPGASLAIDLPHPTARLVLAVVAADDRPLQLTARPQPTRPPVTATVSGADVSRSWFAGFSFERPTAHIEVAADRPCHITFVGYDD